MDRVKHHKRKPLPPREQDQVVKAIWKLQKHFPLAFPVNLPPKAKLKEDIKVLATPVTAHHAEMAYLA